MRALATLGEHVRNDSGGGVRLFGWTEDLISNALFDASIPRGAEIVADISTWVVHVRDNAPSIQDPAAIAAISKWASFVRNSESNWAASLAKACNVSIAAANGMVGAAKGDTTTQKQLRVFFSGEGFRNSWSAMETDRVARLLGRNLSAVELSEAVDRFKDAFAVPVRLQAELLTKLATKEGIALLNPRRKWDNHIWDSAISYLVGKDASVEGIRIELVTDDRDFKSAADFVGCGDRVQTLSDYEASIGVQI